ncbi:hypothetical protein AAC387_Pa01g2563 [Persea americana]
MNRGKRSRHGSAVAVALAQAATTQPPVTRSSHAEGTPEGAGQPTPAQPRVTQSSHVDSMPEVATIARPMDPIRIASSSGQPAQVASPCTDGSNVASGKGFRRVQGKTRGMKVFKLEEAAWP